MKKLKIKTARQLPAKLAEEALLEDGIDIDELNDADENQDADRLHAEQ